MLPVEARYFHESGWFATVRATPVWQDLDDRFTRHEHDNFILLDASTGYRLPHRRGVVAIEAAHLLDQKFGFQDDSFRFLDPVPFDLATDRAVMVRLTLTF